MFELGSYVACIAEGGAETAILELLLDHHLLIFERDTLIDEKILSCRSASAFENRYTPLVQRGKKEKAQITPHPPHTLSPLD